MEYKPSEYQLAIYRAFQETDDNLNISAVAGSGKTTVLLQLLKFIPRDKSALFLAFNNSIVDELRKRIGDQEGVEIMTLHSYGWRNILCRYGSKVKMNPNKGIAKTEYTLKHNFPTLVSAKKYGYYFWVVPKMLDLMRCNLTPNTQEDVQKLADYYDINIGTLEVEVIMKAFDHLVRDKSQFDFMDMIYQPVVDPKIRLKKYDYVFCDESQDFSAAQQEIISRSLNRKGRLITVGDSHQAIYGFAGADANSYERLAECNGKSVSMPLSVSYRCDKRIVEEAQKIVPEIQWAPGAKNGEVRNGSLCQLGQGDWILCRNLRPLIQTYLWLMKNKIKSKIKGKDIGEGIIGMISKTGAKTLNGMWKMLEIEQNKLLVKLEKKGIKHPSLHPKMELMSQRMDVIECLMQEVKNVQQLKELIQDIFADDIKGIMLSTIHKAKGLENDTIFFICPELIPSKFATTDWMYEQERNLKYVAITRAKHELVYVDSCTFNNDIKMTIKI